MKPVDLLHEIIWLECDMKANVCIKLLFDKIQNGLTKQENSDLKKFALEEMQSGLFEFVAMISNGKVCFDWFEKTILKIRREAI
jgi:hypothetical protein